MDIKTLPARVEIKDADKGEVDCVFATTGVKDSDGDVTVAGAFEDGAAVRISAYGHMSWMGRLPVGKGSIRELRNEAIMSGRFFMDTDHGKNTFLTVKALEELQEWSYGYDVVKSSFGKFDDDDVRFLESLKTYEVSPVLLGAGLNTRTLNAKGINTTLLSEATDALAIVTALADRAADVVAKRAEKGKGIGQDTASILAQIEAQCKRWVSQPDTAPDSITEDNAALIKAYLSDIRRRHAVGA